LIPLCDLPSWGSFPYPSKTAHIEISNQRMSRLVRMVRQTVWFGTCWISRRKWIDFNHLGHPRLHRPEVLTTQADSPYLLHTGSHGPVLYPMLPGSLPCGTRNQSQILALINKGKLAIAFAATLSVSHFYFFLI
jgi:hypothetical protein